MPAVLGCDTVSSVFGKLGNEFYNRLLFMHAVLGCDTASSVFGFGKGLAIKKYRKDNSFTDNEDITVDDIIKYGERELW